MRLQSIGIFNTLMPGNHFRFSKGRNMKIATIICRILLGLGFTVFGLNILHPFLPMPPMDPNSLPAKFGAVMFPTHWMTLVGVFQLAGGLLVLFGGTAPL